MYQPKFNSVLVEIDDKDGEWGGENQENMLGKSFSKGKVIAVGELLPTQSNPLSADNYEVVQEDNHQLIGKDIMWNEGTEAGTTFEEDGKLYGFIYWFDIRGIKE